MSVDKTDMLWSGTGSGNYANTGQSEQVVYKVAWADRYTEMYTLIGTIHSDAAWLICTSVNLEPFGDPDSSTGIPASAKLTANFISAAEANRDGGVLHSDITKWAVDVNVGGEALTLKWKNWEFSDTALTAINPDEATNATKIIPIGQINVRGTWTTWSKAKVTGVVGKINSAAFLGYGAQELLFNGIEVNEQTAANGSDAYGLSYNFGWQPQTWNKGWNDKTQKWEAIRKVGDSATKPYDTQPFSDLNPMNW